MTTRQHIITVHKRFIISIKHQLVNAKDIQEAAQLRTRIAAAHARLQIILSK